MGGQLRILPMRLCCPWYVVFIIVPRNQMILEQRSQKQTYFGIHLISNKVYRHSLFFKAVCTFICKTVTYKYFMYIINSISFFKLLLNTKLKKTKVTFELFCFVKWFNICKTWGANVTFYSLSFMNWFLQYAFQPTLFCKN